VEKGSATVTVALLCVSHGRSGLNVEISQNLIEKSTKAPREGTRPTGNGQNINPL
jgi:hypothetical protein